MAAEDQSLCACIVQAPHVDGIASMAMIPRAVLPRLVVAGIRDILGSLIGRKPYTIPIVAPHGAVGALTAPDAEAGYRAMVPPGVDWADQVGARVALTTPMFSPGRKVQRIKCPVLVCIADQDATVPPAAAQKMAERLSNAEVKHYPFGHFEICIGEAFEQVVADQVAFLRRTMPPVADLAGLR
jgi:pimeloyl-ACP methyl ester carboxylesterase